MVKKCDCISGACDSEPNSCACSFDVASFLSKNGRAILLASSLVILCFATYSAYSLIQNKIENKSLLMYSSASSTDELISWIDSGVPSSLADLRGFAALKVANEKYSSSNFAEAAKFYSVAAKSFTIGTFSNLAIIGNANALLCQNNASEAELLLNGLSNNAALNALKFEADYSLGLLAAKAGDVEKLTAIENSMTNAAIEQNIYTDNIKVIKASNK